MKTILEQALVHLLNNESEKAQELMHQFIVERAKEIHEGLRESDEADMEDLDSALEEEFFTEADLEDAEAAENLEDDLNDAEVSDEDLGGEVADEGEMAGDDLEGEADMDMDADADMGEDEGDISTKIDEIEDEIQALQAEFDKIMAEFEGGDEDADMDFDAGEEEVSDAEDFGGEAEFGGEEVEDEEDFDDITEGMVDDLKKVTTPNDDGKGANGEKLGSETKSPIAKDAKNTVLASKNTVGHTGFDLEAAPSKKDGPDRGRKYDNNRSKATDGNKPMAASGPKGAELAKPVAGKGKSTIDGGKIKK